MSSPGSKAGNRAYYDAFATTYDDGRDRGYHKLIDDQAAALVQRVGEGRELLEVGCGTGLILERVARFAKRAEGIDLSPGMLQLARERGLEVREGDCKRLPFDDASFDVVYSFKVLAHVPQVEDALSEMLRVLRPGGHLIYDIYNRRSLRYWIKRGFGPRKSSEHYDEAAIDTHFALPEEAVASRPPGTTLVHTAGIRILTPHPYVLRMPLVGKAVEGLEWRLMDSALARFAGFWVLTLQKGIESEAGEGRG